MVQTLIIKWRKQNGDNQMAETKGDNQMAHFKMAAADWRK
jgi:hypothetical protein